MTPKINFRSVRVKAVLGAGALAALVAVAVPLVNGGGHADRPGRTPAAEPAGPSPNPGQSGPITLIPGRRWVDGLALGYPDTGSGALSAGLEYTAAFVESLDPARLRVILRDVTAPGERIGSAPDSVARNDRALIGAPESGPLPAGAALVLTGRMYRLLGFDQGRARLLLLFTMAASGPNSPDLSGQVMALPVRLNWVGGDWKLAAWDGGTGYKALIAAPDSTAAFDNGWVDLPSAADGPGSWS